MHAFMPGCPVCIIELLLLILCFSDKLNNEMALKVKLDLENNVSRSPNASHISKISRLRSRVIYFTRYFPGTHTQTHLTDRKTWTTKFGRQTFVSDSEARCLSMLRDSAVSERDGFDIYLDKDRLTVKSVAVSI